MSAFSRLYNAWAEGIAKRGETDWMKVEANAAPLEEHLRHAKHHIDLAISGNTDEDHIGHALGRLVLAAELQDANPH